MVGESTAPRGIYSAILVTKPRELLYILLHEQIEHIGITRCAT